MKQEQFDWERSQRQPAAAIAVILVRTFWQLIKAFWPFLLLPLLRSDPEKAGRYEVISIAFLCITVLVGLLKYWFFKFYIQNDSLVIKKGWLKKEMQVIPLEKIQTVNVEQGPLHQMLNIVKLSIDTAGSQKTEAVIEALNKPMAHALQEKLLSSRSAARPDISSADLDQEVILELTDRDLLRLSISANHLETLAILFIFIVGIVENVSSHDEETLSRIDQWMPDLSFYPLLFFSAAVLMITVLVSTGRVFFSFYNFRIARKNNLYQITSGLVNIKEKVVAFKKIQYVSVHANWIRARMKLYMMEFFIAGGEQVDKKSRIRIPITRASFVHPLLQAYHFIPDVRSKPIRIHAMYVLRRGLIASAATALVVFLLWRVWGSDSLYLLLYPALVWLHALLRQKKFRLYATDDVIYIKNGVYGDKQILFKWYKLQSVAISQSIFQRRRNLASVTFHTAGGAITIPYILYPAAKELADFALVKTEFSGEKWM